jgi:hypothetical protein
LEFKQFFYPVAIMLNVGFSLMTLQRLLTGRWRQFPLLTLLLVLNLLIIVPPFTSWISQGNWALPQAQRMYWTLGLASQLTIFLFVLHMTIRAGQRTQARPTVIASLAALSIAIAAVSVGMHWNQKPNWFMSLVTRDLTFLAAVMTMILWRYLVMIKGPKDFLLLAVCTGLGIQCSGDAIGYSLRMANPEKWMNFGDYVTATTAVLTVGIWQLAFAKARPSSGQPGTRQDQGEERALAGSQL